MVGEQTTTAPITIHRTTFRVDFRGKPAFRISLLTSKKFRSLLTRHVPLCVSSFRIRPVTRMNVRARYGWGKTVAAFVLGGALVSFLSDVVFPHSHVASSIAFGVVFGLSVSLFRPFEPRSTPPRGD